MSKKYITTEDFENLILNSRPNEKLHRERMFALFCSKGTLEQVKMCIKVNPFLNFSYNRNYPFLVAANRNRKDVTKFIASITPDIKIKQLYPHTLKIEDFI